MSDYDYEYEDENSGFSLGSVLFNVVTIFLIVAACGIAALVIYILATPDNFLTDFLGTAKDPTPTLASVAVVPTVTPVANKEPDEPNEPAEPTSAREVPPTNTPLPPLETRQDISINTPRPTLTPTIGAALPTNTSTPTSTPTPTDTATPGPSPTVTNTRSPFPFTKDLTSPQFLQNYANNAGCDWMGIAGIVLDVNGNPVAHGEYVVHVWDSGIDVRVVVGDATAYGPSGYEQFLYNEPRFQENNVQLETRNGTAVSQVYRLQTRTSCNENLIRFDFIQNH